MRLGFSPHPRASDNFDVDERLSFYNNSYFFVVLILGCCFLYLIWTNKYKRDSGDMQNIFRNKYSKDLQKKISY